MKRQEEKEYWKKEWKECKHQQPLLCKSLEKKRIEWHEDLKEEITGKTIKEIADIKAIEFERSQKILKENLIKLKELGIKIFSYGTKL